MRLSPAALFVLAAIAGFGCSKKPQPAKERGTIPAEGRSTEEDTKGGAEPTPAPGASPALAMTIWPEHWGSVGHVVESYIPASLPAELGAEIRRQLSDPWKAASALLEASRVPVDLSAPGIDPSAPVTAGIYPPEVEFEKVALTAMRGGDLDSQRLPRLRIDLGASDPVKAARTMGASLGKAKFTELAGLWVSERRAVRLTPLSSTLVVEVFELWNGAKRKEAALKALVGPAPTGPAAIAFALPGASALRARVRADGLSQLNTSLGMMNVIAALESVQGDPDLVARLLVEGTSEVITSVVVIDSDRALASGAYVNVPAREPALSLALPLTESGRAMIDEGVAKTDLGDAKALPRILPHLAESGAELRAIFDLFLECGYGCRLFGFAINAPVLFAAMPAGSNGELTEALSFGDSALAKKLGAIRAKRQGGVVFIGEDVEAWKGFAPTKPTDGARERGCFRDGLATIRGGLRAASRAAPATRAAALAEAKTEAEEQQACVAEDPSLAERFAVALAILDEARKLSAKAK